MTTLDQLTEDLEHNIDRARKLDPVQMLVDMLEDKRHSGWSTPVAETLRWCGEDVVTVEATRNLWLTVEKVHENLLGTDPETTLVQAFVVWFTEVRDQFTFGWLEGANSTSPWSNVTARTNADATQKWLRDSRWLFEQCSTKQA